MEQWHFSVDGRQSGPMDRAEAVRYAAAHPQAFAWRPGFAEWLPVPRVAELAAVAGTAAPPPAPAGRARADDIEFRIGGHEMQYVEIELDPGESAVAEAGAMMVKDTAVAMETVFGDGSGTEGPRFMDKLLGAGKRLLTGESLFTTVFTHTGSGKAKVSFAAPFPGTILPIRLSEVGGRLICQRDSFLAAAKGVQIGIAFQRRILTGLFGGEGFVMQRLEGEGWVFVHMGGCTVRRELAAGETIDVDTGCLAAMTADVQFDIRQAGGVRTMLFGGEGFFFATLTGPGTVWLQSLPFSRLAGRMLSAAPQRGGSQGEGSILPLGGILRGDR